MDLSGKIVFSSGSAVDFDIWSLDLKSGLMNQLTIGDNWNDYPRWSPDGAKIAYISSTVGSPPALFTMNADGSDKKQLTHDIYCQYVSWSPDGRQLAFTSNAVNRQEINLCLINSDGSGTVQSILDHKGVETQPSWSPDGKFIVFAVGRNSNDSGSNYSGPGDTDILKLNLSTGKVDCLVSHPAKDFSPCYSPDGSRIAFISCRNKQTLEHYAQQIEKIKSAVARDDMPAVNQEIKTLHSLQQDSDVWVMNSDGNDLKILTKNSGLDNSVAWSPCGSYLVLTQASTGINATERLAIISSATGDGVPFKYDRTALENEIGIEKALNATFLQLITPDFIERRFADPSFFGEERHPHWTA